jgi:hypothetical protein
VPIKRYTKLAKAIPKDGRFRCGGGPGDQKGA